MSTRRITFLGLAALLSGVRALARAEVPGSVRACLLAERDPFTGLPR
jgi:hypothetical protein